MRKTMSDRIRDLRLAFKMTQGQVGKAVGVTQEAISQLERFPDRVPSSETLQNLAGLFNVEAEWLLTGKGTQNPVASLTEEESELVLLFRALSPSGRAYILGRTKDVYRDEYQSRAAPPKEPPADNPRPRPGRHN